MRLATSDSRRRWCRTRLRARYDSSSLQATFNHRWRYKVMLYNGHTTATVLLVVASFYSFKLQRWNRIFSRQKQSIEKTFHFRNRELKHDGRDSGDALRARDLHINIFYQNLLLTNCCLYQWMSSSFIHGRWWFFKRGYCKPALAIIVIIAVRGALQYWSYEFYTICSDLLLITLSISRVWIEGQLKSEER
jgi:hypothetical protein